MLITTSKRRWFSYTTILALMAVLSSFATAASQKQPPNILVIWGDDIGYWNLSTNNDGMMGYQTPNIDSIAEQGAKFTDAYSEQSCTAGRSAFITGQHPIRTGLLKVGLPGAKEGLSEKDPTIATLLKPHGYATAQIGKNHLGDRNEFLPTLHGFDEFFGNLYHLNAEEEPENPDYPKDPAFDERFGGRAVYSIARQATKTTGRKTHASAKWVSRYVKIPVRSPRSAWKPSRTSCWIGRSILCPAQLKVASRFSSGITQHACITGLI